MKLINFAILLFFVYSMQASANTVDSLLNLLEDEHGSDNQERLWDLHYNLGKEYIASGVENYKEAVYHFNISLNIANKLQDYDKIAESHQGIGRSHLRRNNYQEALKSYYAILEYTDDQIENNIKAKAFTRISSIYQELGDYEKAFESQMEAILINEVNDDSMGIANGHYNLGSIFYYQAQYEQALDHYQKAMVICDAMNNKKTIFSCLGALGTSYEKLGDNEKSLEYNKRSLELAKELNYKSGTAYAMGNIAVNYRVLGNFVKAEQYLKESIYVKLELEDKWGAIGSKLDLSRLYLQWGKPEQAIPILENTLLLGKQVDSKARKPDIYQLLAEVYDQMKDTKKAYFYTKKYIALKDSLISEKTLEEMGQTKRRYEAQLQEDKIEILKKKNELLAKNEKIQKQQKYIFAIGFFAFVMFLWWYKNKLSYQNKMNQLLEEKNSILNLKNEEIHIKNKQLEYSNEDLQKFAYVASHDLKEPLRMISSYTTLLDRRYNQKLDEAGNEFMHYIIDAVKRMEILLDDLLDFSRAGSQKAPTDFISMNDVMVYVEANLRHRLETLNATLIVKSENLPKVKAHRTQLLQLLQNLVSNGVKFKGDRDPIVTVDCEKRENQFVISVKDNGIGISKENLEKVFEMFRRLHTRDEYEGTGIGLATCKRIVTSWGGDIWVESVEGEGSTFFFSVPLSMANSEAAAKLEAVVP